MSSESSKEEIKPEGSKDDNKPENVGEQKLKNKIRERATYKRKITIVFESLKELHDEETLTASFCKKQLQCIDAWFAQIKLSDDKITRCMESLGWDQSKEESYNEELDSQAMYGVKLSLEADKYESYLTSCEPTNSNGVSVKDFSAFLSKLEIGKGKPPPLKCGCFNGMEKDKFAFNTFLNQFNNIIDSRANLSKAAKLTYLHGYLRGYALKVISHLPVSNSNYEIALNLLKEEFLDVEFIKDETFKSLLNACPDF